MHSLTIRILSYNIRHGVGLDGVLDLERIARVIRSASPDVVALQEVDRATNRSEGVHQVKVLSELTGMEFAYGPSMDFDGGEYGNAVLSRLAIRDHEVVPLPGEPRSALCVTLKPAGNSASAGELRFISTHLDFEEAEHRLHSVPLIEAVLESDPAMPAILAGDMNAVPGSPTISALGRTWTNATAGDELLTFPADEPVEQIDHIFYRASENWTTIERSVLNEAVASDHRPILAVLEVTAS